MKVGFVTIKEADSFLSTWIDSGKWQLAAAYPSIVGSGTINESNKNILNGSSTSFITSLIVGQCIKIDDYLAKIVSITSDTVATLDRELEVVTGTIYKLTPSEYESESVILKQKIQSLFYAYNKLVNSPFYVITIIDNVTPANVKYAQILLALNYLEERILKTTTESIHTKNQSEGIQSYGIGDMNYTYQSTTLGNKINSFPQDVQDFMNSYKTTNQMIHPGRAGNPVESMSIPFEVYNQWLRFIAI